VVDGFNEEVYASIFCGCLEVKLFRRRQKVPLEADWVWGSQNRGKEGMSLSRVTREEIIAAEPDVFIFQQSLSL
jgi:hypothetical protein